MDAAKYRHTSRRIPMKTHVKARFKIYARLLLPVGLALVVGGALELGLALDRAEAWEPVPPRSIPTETVTVAVPYSGDQLSDFEAVLAEFTSQTGIATQVEEYDDPDRLRDCSASGDCPNVALAAGPCLVSELASDGALVDLNAFINSTELVSNYTAGWISRGMVSASLYAVWFNGNNKSLVWYDPVEFSSHSWQTPTKWTEVISLSDHIVSLGLVPWSIGTESGPISGWPLTDWFEDILLRSAGPAVYDDLSGHDIPWTSAEVISAGAYFGEILGNEEYQLDGKSGTLNRSWLDAVFVPFETTPSAYLHRQGSFAQGLIANHFPAQTAGTDYAVFPFPDIEPAYSNAVLVAGDQAVVVFSDTTGARALVNFLISVDAADIWASQGHSSPNRRANSDLYPDPNTRAAAEQLANADIVRFDLSDQLPEDLRTFLYAAMLDLVQAAPDPDAMEIVLLRIEARAAGWGSVYVPLVTSE
jgi:alpha-glucoside transport system substrate-binding protein